MGQFHTRVEDALHEIAAGHGPALVVTSGGLIAMAMAQAMGLDIPAMARMALAIMHTSMHRLLPIGGHLVAGPFQRGAASGHAGPRGFQTHI